MKINWKCILWHDWIEYSDAAYRDCTRCPQRQYLDFRDNTWKNMVKKIKSEKDD